MLSIFIAKDITILFIILTCIFFVPGVSSLSSAGRREQIERNSLWQTKMLHFSDFHDILISNSYNKTQILIWEWLEGSETFLKLSFGWKMRVIMFHSKQDLWFNIFIHQLPCKNEDFIFLQKTFMGI